LGAVHSGDLRVARKILQADRTVVGARVEFFAVPTRKEMGPVPLVISISRGRGLLAADMRQINRPNRPHPRSFCRDLAVLNGHADSGTVFFSAYSNLGGEAEALGGHCVTAIGSVQPYDLKPPCYAALNLGRTAASVLVNVCSSERTTEFPHPKPRSFKTDCEGEEAIGCWFSLDLVGELLEGEGRMLVS